LSQSAAKAANMAHHSPLRKWINLKLHRRGRFAESTTVSLVVRPILEKERIKTWLCVPLMAAVVSLGGPQLTEPPTPLDTWSTDKPVQTVLAYTMNVPDGNEEDTYLVPVQDMLGVSQGFHSGHPGMDLRAPLGTNVIAMDNGVVESIIESPFGYGRHVIIREANGIETLYAHLGLIKVAEGDELRAGNVIGTIGTTGWSTGPHLHFEVRENGAQVNPIKYIGKSLDIIKQEALAAAH
jgi:murein DD-endopeptidase MepM/ murein hydrolase activator NlpD